LNNNFAVHVITNTEFVHASGNSKRKCAFVAGYDNVVFSAHGGTVKAEKTERQNKIVVGVISDCDVSFTLEPRITLGAKLANYVDGTVAHINRSLVAVEGYQLRWVRVHLSLCHYRQSSAAHSVERERWNEELLALDSSSTKCI
jgi:hypothetical protein